MDSELIFTPLDHLAQAYGRQIFDVLAPQVSILFNAGFGVWLLWMLIYRGCVRSDLRFEDFVTPLFFCTMVALFLRGHSLYWEWFYQPVYQTTTSLAQTILSVGAARVNAPTIPGMLQTLDLQLDKVFKLSEAIRADGGIFSPNIFLGGLLMLVPFLFIWGLFLAYVLEMAFKLLMVTAISPLLIMCVAFPSLRGITIAGLRIVLNGCLTLILASVAMGFTLAAVDNAVRAASGGAMADFVFSTEYWTLFVLGFISILFHLKASTVAANLSGSQDGPGAAATVVAAGMATMGLAKSGALKLTQRTGNALGRGVDEHLKRTNFKDLIS